VLQLQPYPDGDFSWHHLWFIAYLYVYVLLATPLLAWVRRLQWKPAPGAWLFAAGLPLGFNEALLKPLFPEAHNLVSDWYIFNHYLLLTLYGFLLALTPGAWEWLERKRRIALGLAAATLAVALAAFELNLVARNTPSDAMIANLFTWWMLMAFLGYGRRHLSFGNRLLTWARDASYPIYILHQTVIILIAWPLIEAPLGAGAKYVLVLVATMAVCAATYEVAIRRVGWLRLALGMRPKPRPARLSESWMRLPPGIRSVARSHLRTAPRPPSPCTRSPSSDPSAPSSSA
jgi:peptidoglycan/LPS O-acetylase OafA/YrhL